MFNTAASFGTMLLENQYDGLDQRDYTQLQWQRGLFMFH